MNWILGSYEDYLNLKLTTQNYLKPQPPVVRNFTSSEGAVMASAITARTTFET
ncbi:hypothetical protein [Companilactobacillus muriivasis]|uniref:hypothetical protein n=1 Tax=Companilactobacillus muriivasis TaxID=3081444 RepID=UPI0030C6DA87